LINGGVLHDAQHGVMYFSTVLVAIPTTLKPSPAKHEHLTQKLKLDHLWSTFIVDTLLVSTSLLERQSSSLAHLSLSISLSVIFPRP